MSSVGQVPLKTLELSVTVGGLAHRRSAARGASHRFLRNFLQADVLPQLDAGKVQHQHCHIAELIVPNRRVELDARPAPHGPR